MPGRHFQPSVMLASKAGAYLRALPSRVGSCMGLPGKNTLAYLPHL
jgi:hypothetical protein